MGLEIIVDNDLMIYFINSFDGRAISTSKVTSGENLRISEPMSRDEAYERLLIFLLFASEHGVLYEYVIFGRPGPIQWKRTGYDTRINEADFANNKCSVFRWAIHMWNEFGQDVEPFWEISTRCIRISMAFRGWREKIVVVQQVVAEYRDAFPIAGFLLVRDYIFWHPMSHWAWKWKGTS